MIYAKDDAGFNRTVCRRDQEDLWFPIVLLKETSISGYIGLMDLTRGGDIIRSQTYSALFPLLVVAAIYLVIVCFLTYLVGRLERRLRANERK